ncbi:MAG: FHA domain-containing protein [Myxococcota bacterium]
MNPKHRITPIAPAPMQRSLSTDRPPAHQLKAPIVVVTPVGEFEHERGGLVLGRADDANVVIDDPLISRAHARLVVQPDETVVVEDLHSTNGVFVNGVRLARPSCRLAEGDRLLIGTTEVSVFSSRASATIPIEHHSGEVLKRPVPPPTTQGFGELGGLGKSLPVTDRSNAVELVGNLARRLMSTGRSAEAVRVLSDHLNNVLLGASAGLSVPESVLEHACEHAVELFHWTSRAAWLDYVFQLHLSCQRVPSSRSLDLVERELQPHVAVDRELLHYFASSLQVRAEPLTREEQVSVARIARWSRG